MPVNRKFDYILNGAGFMLSRVPPHQGRAWSRTGQPDTPDKRPRATETIGVLPPQIEYPELWNDWSGGFGHPYRQPKDVNSYYGFFENPNRYHWSENFDARFPHQLVHCQRMQTLAARYASTNTNVYNLIDMPVPSLNQAGVSPGMGGVFISVGHGAAATGTSTRLTPTGLAAAGSAFDFGLIANHQPGVGRPAIFGSYLYLVNALENAWITRQGLDDIPTGAGGTLPIRGYAMAGNRLWGYHGMPTARFIYAQSVAAQSDPYTFGNWSATLSIGDGHHQITDIRAYKDQLFLGMEDGLYAGDLSGTFINVLNDLSGNSDADNCRDIAIYNGTIVVQHIAGVYSYNPNITTTGQVREVGPNLLANRSPVTGKIRTLEAYGPWLYAGLWTGSQSYLLAGIDTEGNGPYRWHVLNRYPHIARPQRIHVDGITMASGGVTNLPQRMWAATDPSIGAVGTAPLYWWPIPLLNGDPLGTSLGFSANYVGSARMDLGIVDSRAPATNKLYKTVTIESENLGSPNIYCDIYYTVDQGTRTLLGRAIDSPRSVLYFPSTGGSFITGKAIELSMESFTALPATSPVYRSIILRSTFRPNSVDMITAITDVADETRDRQGSTMRPGASQLAELRALSRQAQAVTLVDLAGASNMVVVLAPVEEAEVYQDGDQNPTVAATLKMAVLTFTGPAT